ncbi:hypothetical protein HYFRA_00008140 [Hymenoscyphus fraxineus]|uniref:Cep57 centrosome microtubule-binding domain-containing protein n=1 Tax=Hymenoscyphus fraxineus TaxID=746836 RepID=A0A9N9LAB5_9HELO|nr:hypothetical protein HYFRA_00008140 [Hymenoscyphus fraxineus]
MAARHSGARMDREKNRPYSFHSPASSTGSNHGTVSTDTTRDTTFDPRRDDAEMSTLPIVSAGLAKKLPALRETASKYDRFKRVSPQHTWDINTSQIGKAFPEFSDAENSQSLSLETSRAAPAVKSFSQQNNRKSSNIHVVETVELRKQTRSPKQSSPYISNASRLANLQAQVTEDSENSFMNLSVRRPASAVYPEKQALPAMQTTETSDISFMGATAKQSSNAAFPAKYNLPGLNNRPVPAASNVSSKRHRFDQHPTPAVLSKTKFNEQSSPCPTSEKSQSRIRAFSNNFDTQTTQTTNTGAAATSAAATATTNPTSQSFFFPGTPGHNASASGNTLTNGLPNFTQNGKAHDRNMLKASLHNANYGPVDSIVVPDDEEDIYQLIDALKKRIFRSESQKESFESQITTQQQQIERQQSEISQLKAANGLLQKTHTELEQRAVSLQGLNMDLERELAMTMKHVGSLEKENKYMAQIEQQYQQAIQEKKILSRQHSDIVMKESQYIAEIEQYHQQSTILRRQNSDLVQKFNRIKEENEELRQTAQGIKKQPTASTEKPTNIGEDARNNFDVSPNVKQYHPSALKAQLDAAAAQKDATHHTNISVTRHTNVSHHSNVSRNITRHTTQMSGISVGDFTQPTMGTRTNGDAPAVTRRVDADMMEDVDVEGDDVEITGSAFILPDIKNSYIEEATARPSELPADALRRLKKNAQSTLDSLVEEHNALFTSYSNLDPSMQRRNHRRHEEGLKKLTDRIQKVKEELYSLEDVKHGVK